MKKGVILYMVGGSEVPRDELDLGEQKRSLGVDAICLASSEFEVSYHWWHFLTRGIQEISCMKAAYDEGRRIFDLWGAPLKLCG